MKILEKFKSLSLLALAAIFFLSATLISCGDSKKEASSEENETEEVIMEESEGESEHPSDGDHEHPSSEEHSDSTKSEHPSGGGEHPTN